MLEDRSGGLAVLLLSNGRHSGKLTTRCHPQSGCDTFSMRPCCSWRWSFLPFKAVKDAAPWCSIFSPKPHPLCLGALLHFSLLSWSPRGPPQLPTAFTPSFCCPTVFGIFSLSSEISGNEDPCFLENDFDLDEPWGDLTLFLLPSAWGKPPHYCSWCLQYAWNRAWWVRTWIGHWSPMPCFKSHVTTY